MVSKRLVFLLGVLAVVLVVAYWQGQQTPQPIRPIEPPLPFAKNQAAPLKLYKGAIPTSGAATLTILAHMS
jgi:hypothetical protein